MNNYLYKTLLSSLFLFAVLAGSMPAQVQVNMKTFNSLRPAKADVKIIDDGIEYVQEQVAKKGSAREMASDIAVLEKRVANVRKDFKRFKKLKEWDASLAALKKDQARLAQEEAAVAKANKEAAAAKKAQESALYKVTNTLRKSILEKYILNFRGNPSYSNGNKVVVAASEVMPVLDAYREKYPEDQENEALEGALKAESYVKGDFLPAYKETLTIQRKKDEKFIAEKRAAEPDRAYNVVNRRLGDIYKALILFPDAPYFTEIRDQDKALRAEIDTYRTDGSFDAYKLDQVRIPPSKGKDAKVNAGVRRAMEEEGYAVAVVSIRDDRWVLVKNEFGIPKHKEKEVVVGVRKDGLCYRIFGTYRLSYAGGGTYQSEGYFRWNDPKKMNCSNLK